MILIVEDEAKIARFVQLELEHEGYEVRHISDGRMALESALAHDYDLIILDLMLPGMSGIELLRRLRQTKDTPVLILTARDQIMDKVAGLDIGADDYMTKPFAIEELLARIRVHLKRREAFKGEKLTYGKLVVDRNARSVTYEDVPVELTKKEYDLLVYLLENRNTVITREQAAGRGLGLRFLRQHQRRGRIRQVSAQQDRTTCSTSRSCAPCAERVT